MVVTCVQELISTKKAFCKDCYKCLRVCDVKAIGVKNGQAKVDEVRCILCGNCVKECPREAKVVKNQTYYVKELLQSKIPVVLSVAPSYAAVWTNEEWLNIKQRLYDIGFSAIEETAIGVEETIEGYLQLLAEGKKKIITSCCPVIVNHVEKYYPSLINNLAPVYSPMVNHANKMRSIYGAAIKVVFLGPCIAKMQEGLEGDIEAVIGYTQLDRLFKECNNIIKTQEKLETEYSLPTLSKAYPLHQGVIKAIKQINDDISYYSAQGVKECKEVLTSLVNNELEVDIVELMACQGGCLGGPLMPETSMVNKTQKFIKNLKKTSSKNISKKYPTKLVSEKREFSLKTLPSKDICEGSIKDILRKMGKLSSYDEKNCGGCGYESCREKAMAVIYGMAELEMCIPYMRQKAESMANAIVEATPNAIFVVNSKMEVQDFNPSAQKLFTKIPWAQGLDLSKYLDVKYLFEVRKNQRPLNDLKVVYVEWGLVTRQIISPIAESDSIMAIVTDLTDIERRQLEIDQMRDEVIEKAHEVINRQMTVAQQIAGLLGETTAETKATLLELLGHLKNTGVDKP